MIARFRSASLLAIGVLALHQLRYLGGYGSDAGRALAEQGHGYFGLLLPVLLGLLLAGVGSRVVSLARRGEREGGGPGLGIAACAAVLLTAYSAQELAEGALAAGHPAGVAAVLAYGGWIAAPLSLLVGAVCWALIRWLDSFEHQLALVLSRPPVTHRAPQALGRRRLAPGPLLSSFQLAFGIAGRAPPFSS